MTLTDKSENFTTQTYTIQFYLSRGDGSLSFVILSIAKNPGLDPSAFGVRMTQEGGAFPSAFGGRPLAVYFPIFASSSRM